MVASPRLASNKGGNNSGGTGLPCAGSRPKGAVRVLILKPMMIGWWADTIAILEDAYRHDVACVLTTSLESAVGRRITAAFAARYAPLGHAHGLATGSLFTRDVIVKPDPIRNGDYHPESVSDIDSAMLEPVP